MSRSTIALLGVVLGSLVAPVTLIHAQQPSAPAAAPGTPATPGDVASLVGEWSLAMESPMGPSTTTMVLRVDAGKVVADLSSEMMPKTTISDIKKSGTTISISYSFDMQGQAIPIHMTLTPRAKHWGWTSTLPTACSRCRASGRRRKP